MSWREVFGIAANAQTDFEHVHDLYRERIADRNIKAAEAYVLGAALAEAKRELRPVSIVDDTVHTEQLLPP
jgi:hypothetical protein